MSKELIVSSSPHETRVAMLEDGQLCEIYIEREKEYALVGSIYKGRVTRVLPGMQSAFVDIGLDTDAFLYVSDVLEDLEEYDHIAPAPESRPQAAAAALAPPAGPVARQEAAQSAQPAPEPAPALEPAPASEPAPRTERPERAGSREGGRFDRRGGRFGRHGRRGKRGGRDLPPSKYASSDVSSRPSPSEPEPEQDTGHVPVILPGESLAKYKDRLPQPAGEFSAESESTPKPELREPSAPGREEYAPAREEAQQAREPRTGFAQNAGRPAESYAAERESARVERESRAPFESESRVDPVLSEGASEVKPVAEVPAAETSKPGVVSAPTDDELSFEETATLTETLADHRQEESLEEENGENGETADEQHDGASGYEPEPEAENGSPADADLSEPSGPQPGNEISSVRMDQPSRSLLQRPMGRERHRGGRRHRRQREGDRPQRRFAPPRRVQQIADLLKAGQEVIIQITKEPLGKKGARITSHVALPGRFLVYMPTLDHVGISRKIGTGEMRGRLRKLVEELRQGHSGGFIVRTAAGGASEDDVRADAEYLINTWQEIRSKSEQRRPPSLLHRDLNLVERLLRDCLNRDFSAVWVDSEEEYARVVDFISRFQPDLVSRVKLYTKEMPIFEEMGVQQEIDKSLRPKVWLKSGGYIVINHTEALVAIDVNTGKYVGRGSSRLEDTIVKTNIDAVKEIVRQIRLRDLGGIIVIDFIDMEERRNRDKVLQALEDALRQDRAPSKVLPFNEFGLVAITRKRTKQALERMLCQPCPYCSGSGMVKSVPTICYEIEAEARKMAGELDSPSVTLRVNPEIAKALKTREANLVEELEHVTHKNVVIQSDATLHFEQYDIY
ncbi:MAG TPA: Rne/Rng family ribonuclease [Patescibacteria group bacterium]|nr:Rne/Rng family ribonuclease [Patescibacteria group bacterium]